MEYSSTQAFQIACRVSFGTIKNNHCLLSKCHSNGRSGYIYLLGTAVIIREMTGSSHLQGDTYNVNSASVAASLGLVTVGASEGS